jgi:hypothetical protein
VGKSVTGTAGHLAVAVVFSIIVSNGTVIRFFAGETRDVSREGEFDGVDDAALAVPLRPEMPKLFRSKVSGKNRMPEK